MILNSHKADPKYLDKFTLISVNYNILADDGIHRAMITAN